MAREALGFFVCFLNSGIMYLLLICFNARISLSSFLCRSQALDYVLSFIILVYLVKTII